MPDTTLSFAGHVKRRLRRQLCYMGVHAWTRYPRVDAAGRPERVLRFDRDSNKLISAQCRRCRKRLLREDVPRRDESWLFISRD